MRGANHNIRPIHPAPAARPGGRPWNASAPEGGNRRISLLRTHPGAARMPATPEDGYRSCGSSRSAGHMGGSRRLAIWAAYTSRIHEVEDKKKTYCRADITNDCTKPMKSWIFYEWRAGITNECRIWETISQFPKFLNDFFNGFSKFLMFWKEKRLLSN